MCDGILDCEEQTVQWYKKLLDEACMYVVLFEIKIVDVSGWFEQALYGIVLYLNLYMLL